MTQSPAVDRPTHFTQADRQKLIDDPEAQALTKRSRILAIQLLEPFTVETDRGVMTGDVGDWLVTNHPDDDATSDLWSISDERMKATYVSIDTPDAPGG